MAVEPLIFELSKPGRRGVRYPEPDVPETPLPEGMMRERLDWPEVSEIDVIRHYTRLSQKNHAIDIGMYPLGSCTMKYNPKINEVVARLPGFANIHPYQDPSTVQGALQLMCELQEMLGEISGFDEVALQPVAGAQGELTGCLVIRAWHRSHGDTGRTKILVPDSAHGTNPATAVMAGFQVVTIPSDARGNCDLEALRAAVGTGYGRADDHQPEHPRAVGRAHRGDRRAPSTRRAVWSTTTARTSTPSSASRDPATSASTSCTSTCTRPSPPRTAAAVPARDRSACARIWRSSCPGPRVRRVEEDDEERYELFQPEESIGRLHAFHGNFGMFVRAYTYIRMHGAAGLRQVSEDAVLAANYIRASLRDLYDQPFGDRTCMHETVFSATRQKAQGVRALDIAKRILDFGIHPPTVYFPLVVPEALMIEPTETESIESLDHFIGVMRQIAHEAAETPEVVQQAPHTTEYKRLDEVAANRTLNLRWRPSTPSSRR